MKRAREQKKVAGNRRPYLFPLIAAALLLFSLAYGWRILSRPDVYFLVGEGGADWIRLDTLPTLFLGEVEQTAWFRARLTADSSIPNPTMYLKALRLAELYVDGKQVFRTHQDATRWKQTNTVEIIEPLAPGEHILEIHAVNASAPAAALLYAPELAIHTGTTWEASSDRKTWTPAALATGGRRPEVASAFPRADQKFISYLPLFALMFAAALVAFYVSRTPTYADSFTPERVKLALFLGIAAMFVNNLFKLPGDLGFDISGHYDYVEYVATKWRIPLPTEGWTMFQAPLFYMLSAPIFALGKNSLSFEAMLDALRIIPMICGVAQIEICYRLAKSVYPTRPGLQIVAMTFGALAPLNLYIAQYPGNEPLCACLCGIAMVMAFDAMANPATGLTTKRLLAVGAVYGLALLAKVSALVLGPPLALMYAYALYQSKPAAFVPRVFRAYATIFGVALLVAGWYYARNWIVLGKPFYGGWEPERGFPWWQEPGFRTPQHYFRFGEALVYPVYSMVWSFWDGFYATFWMDAALGASVEVKDAPPWNYTVLLAGMWWALIPTFAMVAGFIFTFATPRRSLHSHTLFAALVVALYVGAALQLSLTLPYACTIKASHTLAALPCYALMLTAGFELALRVKWFKPVAYALFACWAFSSFAGFFSV